MTYEIAIHILAIYGFVSIVTEIHNGVRWHFRRKPEPPREPYVTPKSLALGGVEGLREERRYIMESLRLVRTDIHRLRQQGPTAAEGPTDLDVALAEYADYSDRRKDVETLIEESSR